jgi:hypothetical protein
MAATAHKDASDARDLQRVYFRKFSFSITVL